MEKFRGVDYYGVEDPPLRRGADGARHRPRLVVAEFLPIITKHHRAGTFPMELVPQLGELGIFGAT